MAINGNGLVNPILQFDNAGVPYAGGSVTFTQVGTNTLQNVFSDAALTIPLPNPVPLNSAGRSSTSITGPDTPVYFSLLPYDFVLKDSAGTIVYGPISFSGSFLPPSANLTVGGNLDVTGTLGVTGATTVTTLTGSVALVASSTTNATSPTTGAIKSAGGLGVANALWVGGLLNVAGVSQWAGLATYSAGGGIIILANPNIRVAIDITSTADLGGGVFENFRNQAAAVQGSITATNSTTTAYNTSSDERLKTDLGLAADLSVLRDTKVHDFTWTESGIVARGVFAQEAVLVNPAAITVGNDEHTADGHLVQPWQADYSKYVADLIVGWQAHESRIVELEARIAALEAKIATQ